MRFFADLLGKTSANAATQLGRRNQQQINQGYDDAGRQAQTGYQTASSRYQPYMESGQRGQTATKRSAALRK